MDTMEPPAVSRRPRVSLWLLRGLVSVHAALVVCQPVLAGLFLTGNVDAIDVHADVALAVTAVSLVVVGVTVGYVVRGRGQWWVPAVAVVLLVAEGNQIHLGYVRELQVHIPLGVAIVGCALALACWVWTPAAGRPR